MTDREKLIELLESAESAVYWDSSDKGFLEKIADHLIQNGVTTQKWIPVTERFPEEDGKYQVYQHGYINDGIHHAYFAKDARKVDRFEFRRRWKNVWYGYDSEWGHYEVGNVTHWMPLPEPPKEG